VFAIAVVSTTAFAGGNKTHAKKEPAKTAPPPVAEPAGSAADGSGDGSATLEEQVPAHIVGPKLVDLGHGAEIELPAGMILFEREVAQDLMRKGGNDVEGTVAVILPPDPENTHWLVVIEADDNGYVNDSDSNDLDPDSMMKDFVAGTEEQNKKRATLGIAALTLDGWSQQPNYDKAKHHLVWGLKGHSTDGPVINFFTRFLGRAGYLSVNLIDDPSTIEQSKKEAMSILDALHFKAGQRYEDHASGDKDSHMGLKALVIGGGALLVAKKTGLLVLLLLFLKKGFIVVIAAVGGFFKWITGKKKKEDRLSMHLPPNDPPPPGGEPPPG
jgi:uncharacterized membrane-anchored protein